MKNVLNLKKKSKKYKFSYKGIQEKYNQLIKR